MVCIFCPTVGVFSGFLGSYLGISPPKTWQGKIFSGVITATLTGISVVALKVFLGITLCSGGGATLSNIVLVGAKTVPMALLYSLGVNYLINRFFSSSDEKNCSSRHSCCCSEKKEL